MNLPDWRRLARVLHRDLGYFFFGATVVYAVSGLALNHRGDWNPSYSVEQTRLELDSADPVLAKPDATGLRTLLALSGIPPKSYQKHYSPDAASVRVFFRGGTATLDLRKHSFTAERLQPRPLLHTFNRLHYNPGRWWTVFSDLFCTALIIVAVTGLFLLRGRHGITRRGGLLVLLGLLLPGLLAIWML